MARKKRDPLQRKKNTREYRNVCWVSAEGQTEKDYLGMNAFRNCEVSIRFPKDIHPGRRNPSQVLKRFKKALRTEDFRQNDEAWVVVDVDTWSEAEFKELLEWEKADPRHHLAISNPKFELFILMHYERANGCTTPQKVDAKLKKHWPRYDKRISPTQFSDEEIKQAIDHARTKRTCHSEPVPAPGMTDAHLLAERLISQ